MCGIVGFTGRTPALPFLLDGLRRMEYRGYDSAGVALVGGDPVRLDVRRAVGKVDALAEALRADPPDGAAACGIGHTRWATHGAPCVRNAHPHLSPDGRIAVVHNGIIDNFLDLRERLRAKGAEFRSDTDSEVIAHLVQECRGGTLLDAVLRALSFVRGTYGIAVVSADAPDEIVVARRGSPVVVGTAGDAAFVASDPAALAGRADRAAFLDDGDVALLRPGSFEIRSLAGAPVVREAAPLDFDPAAVEKGGYEHFMLKEIFEQPECLTNCMRGRVNVDADHVTLSALIDYRRQLLEAKRVVIVACGTSWHAGLIGKQIIESLCRIPVEVEYASEFRYRNPVVGKGDVVIAISQSGETADTLAAVQLAKEKGAFIYGVCNAIGSSIPRATDTGTYIHVGPEIGVASTKAFTGQVTVLTMIALAMGEAKGTVDRQEYLKIVKGLSEIPVKIREVLQTNDKVADLARTFTYAHNFLYLGRGYSYPVALEGALKLKEISYIHAEGYPAAEMKHGPIALIDSDMPVVVIATHNAMYEKVLSNIQEIKARQGRVIALVSKGDDVIARIADEVIELPDVLECLEPLVATIPLQLLAYHVAVCKGKNVDQPRNLAKSVTVE